MCVLYNLSTLYVCPFHLRKPVPLLGIIICQMVSFTFAVWSSLPPFQSCIQSIKHTNISKQIGSRPYRYSVSVNEKAIIDQLKEAIFQSGTCVDGNRDWVIQMIFDSIQQLVTTCRNFLSWMATTSWLCYIFCGSWACGHENSCASKWGDSMMDFSWWHPLHPKYEHWMWRLWQWAVCLAEYFYLVLVLLLLTNPNSCFKIQSDQSKNWTRWLKQSTTIKVLRLSTHMPAGK